jgi:predicted CxxxxCH...CXXCH cytochrome family protein
MKTCQSTGYLQQTCKTLLLGVVSIVALATSSHALTLPNNIDQCYDCHGSTGDMRPVDTIPPNSASSAYRNISTGAVKGSHRAHTTDLKSTATPNDCAKCHGTPAIGATATGHRDGLIQMESAVGYSKLPLFFNQTSVPVLGTCSTASCHSNPYGTGFVTTPTWGTVSGCAACHNSSSGTNAAFDATYGAPLTGAHTMHLAATVACSKCHSNVAKDTNTSSVHINGFINISGYATKQVAKHAINSGYNTCTTTLCHGSASPNWGTVTTNATCTKCHGKGTIQANYSSAGTQAAPGYAQSAGGPYTNGVSATPAYGAHDAHIRAVNQYSTRDVLCSDCHGALPTSSQHANRITDLPFDNLAKNIGTSFAARATLASAYNKTTFTCTAVYCHGDGGVFLGTSQGTGQQPKWNDTAYLTPYAKNTTVCGKCHAALPVVPKKDHSAVAYTAGSCNSCHGHDGNGSKHIDGVLQASGDCNGCHDYDSVGSVWSPATGRYTTVGTWGKSAVAIEGFGAHAKHINYIKARLSISTALDPVNQTFGVGNPKYVCGTCHTNVEANHGDAARLINFGDSAFAMAPSHATLSSSLLFGTSFPSQNPKYNGTSGVSSSTTPKTCSNLSCHYFTTPVWSAP